MTPEQFTYWLQGFIEMEDPKSLNQKQTKMLKEHLSLVFTKATGPRLADVIKSLSDDTTEKYDLTGIIERIGDHKLSQDDVTYC